MSAIAITLPMTIPAMTPGESDSDDSPELGVEEAVLEDSGGASPPSAGQGSPGLSENFVLEARS
jgi:hypothetical protein